MSDDREAMLNLLREEMTRPLFHAILLPRALNVESNGSVSVAIDFRSDLARGPNDRAFHGGVVAALIDIAGHAAVATIIGRMAPTIDLRIDYLRPSIGKSLIAQAKLLKAGRTVARADIDVVNERGELLAVGRGTYSTAAS
jgi:uncharacterized protein (TIGR00369 family)